MLEDRAADVFTRHVLHTLAEQGESFGSVDSGVAETERDVKAMFLGAANNMQDEGYRIGDPEQYRHPHDHEHQQSPDPSGKCNGCLPPVFGIPVCLRVGDAIDELDLRFPEQPTRGTVLKPTAADWIRLPPRDHMSRA